MPHSGDQRRPGADARAWRAAASGLLLLILLVGSGRAQPSPGQPLGTFTDHLDERVPALMDAYEVPGAAVALVRDGALVWAGAYGYANREQERAMSVNAVFRVESISKSVTAWGVMTLVERGHIDLDAPVGRYLDDGVLLTSPYDERAVTVRRLLSHSAGLPLGPIGTGAEYAPAGDVPALRDYLSREARLVRPPGSAFAYSNVGFNLLELLVEAVTGRDFAAYVAEAVLRPLGMRRSSFAWADSLRPHMPKAYALDGTPVPPYVYAASAAGGLMAPVTDVARFVAAETIDSATAKPRVLSTENIHRLHTPQVEIPGLYGVVADAYGLGHFVETLPSGRRAVWHGGQGHGWMTHVHAVPATGDGIVLLTNSERSWPLMARVLSDWARWTGHGAVKMGRLRYGTMGLWAFVGLVGLVSLWILIRLGRGLYSGRRRWAPLSRASRPRRLLQATLGAGVIAGLAWGAAQPYLIVSSIFPATAHWAGLSLLGWSVLLIASALCPRAPD